MLASHFCEPILPLTHLPVSGERARDQLHVALLEGSSPTPARSICYGEMARWAIPLLTLRRFLWNVEEAPVVLAPSTRGE